MERPRCERVSIRAGIGFSFTLHCEIQVGRELVVRFAERRQGTLRVPCVTNTSKWFLKLLCEKNLKMHDTVSSWLDRV